MMMKEKRRKREQCYADETTAGQLPLVVVAAAEHEAGTASGCEATCQLQLVVFFFSSVRLVVLLSCLLKVRKVM